MVCKYHLSHLRSLQGLYEALQGDYMNLFKAIMETFYGSKDYSFQIQTFNPNSYWCEVCKAVHPEAKLTYVSYIGADSIPKAVCLCKKCYKKAMKGIKKGAAK